MYNISKLANWRIVIPTGLALCLILYWTVWGRQNCRLEQAIPAQTAVVLTYEGFKQVDRWLSHQDDSSGLGLSRLSLLRSARGFAAKAAAVFQQQETIVQAFHNRPMAAAFSLLPADSLQPLYVLDLDQRVDLSTLLSGAAGTLKAFSATFKGHTLYTVHLSKQERLVVCSIGNLLVFSRFSYLVEDALVQMNSGGQWWVQEAREAGVAAGIAPFQWIIRPAVLAERWRGKVLEQWGQIPDWLSGQLDWVNIFWTGKLWKIRAGTTPQTRGLGAWAEVPRDDLFSILPDNTALLAWMGGELPKLWPAVLPRDGSAADFRQFIKPWVGRGLAWVVVEPFSPAMAEDQFLVLEMRDSAKARVLLQNYGTERGLLKQYDYQTYEVKQLLSQTLLEPLSEAKNGVFRNPVYALIGNYVVFGATPSAIELWIDKYIVSQTLSNRPDFLQMKSGWKPEGTALLLCNTGYLARLVKSVWQPSLDPVSTDDIRLLGNLGLVSFDLLANTDGFLDLSVRHQPQNEALRGASIFWKLSLGGKAITKPNLVVTDLARNESSILIQDDQLQLYRITTGGTVVWRKQLNQAILSAIQPIDYFKNGSVCFLFNTVDAIWILDAEGHEIAGFPLKLQSFASNEVAVVELDGAKNTALFIACANGNLYGFDQFGRPLPGWNPQAGIGRVKFPLIYFKHQTKDYFAVLSLDGRLSVFNRDGKPHFPAMSLEGSFGQSPLQFDADTKTPRIVAMDTDGRIVVVNLQGGSFPLRLTKAGKQSTVLVLENFFGDGRKEFAVLSGKGLTLSGYEQNAIKTKFQHVFQSPQDTLFSAGCCAAMGALDKTNRQIWLLDEQGRVHADFPLPGTTAFVLAQAPGNREHILIAGNESTVYAYKIR
ncbi:MAG: DUF3352 domain-containing protein [Saprospiraceae bacterium]|nr:DUF3352 domain-containing protein [Saprospiraceae bacterium]